jgi:hypothetical protein
MFPPLSDKMAQQSIQVLGGTSKENGCFMQVAGLDGGNASKLRRNTNILSPKSLAREQGMICERVIVVYPTVMN